MLQPPTPPPMITTCDCGGSSAMSSDLLKPFPPPRIVHRPPHSVEMLKRVTLKIEVELRDRALHDAPHGLPKIGHHLHLLEPGKTRFGSLPEIALEQEAILVVGKIVMDGEVGKVEEHIAHPGVLPIQDPDGAVAGGCPLQQGVVTGG